MIHKIETAAVSAILANEATEDIPSYGAATAVVLPETSHIVVDASAMQLGPGNTAFGELRIRYSAPALPGQAIENYETDSAAIWALFASSASLSAAWDDDVIDLIGCKLQGVTTLAEDNRWVSEFAVVTYVKAAA